MDRLFAYHESPGALERLLPPRINTKVIKSPKSLKIGELADIKLLIAPGLKLRILAEHFQYYPPTLFADHQIDGPFAKWIHQHRFEQLADDRSRLIDDIEWKVSKSGLLDWILNAKLERELKSMFAYRHRVTAQDILLKSQIGRESERLIVSGASGMLGQRVVSMARVMGMQVTKLKRVNAADDVKSFVARDEDGDGIQESPWHVATGTVRVEDWQNSDAVIHLAGANLGGRRWTEKYKQELRRSRVESTERLVAFLKDHNALPDAWVTASGAGIYPDSGDRILGEDVPAGEDFLGQLANDWELASKQVERFGKRWCAARLGMVLDPLKGALVPLLWQWKCFVGGSLGRGDIYWSWLERDDAAAALLWLATQSHCSGAYNLGGESVSNREFATTMSKVLWRPRLAPVPKFVVKMMLGELASSLLLRSNRTDNRKLIEAGYPIRFQKLEDALDHLLV